MASKILKFFQPKDKIFYSLFEEAGVNAKEIAEELIKFVQEPDVSKRESLVKVMRDIEHRNDQVTHKIFMELGKNFITPFDREDIHSLALAMDDICDNIYDAGRKIMLYKVNPSLEGIQKLTSIIQEAVIAVNEAVKELRDLKNTKKIMKGVIKINSAENQADDVYDESIEYMFDSVDDAKLVIKQFEIYRKLEGAANKCEDAGNVIESIIVKYA